MSNQQFMAQQKDHNNESMTNQAPTCKDVFQNVYTAGVRANVGSTKCLFVRKPPQKQKRPDIVQPFFLSRD
jgi:hypothetical protein